MKVLLIIKIFILIIFLEVSIFSKTESECVKILFENSKYIIHSMENCSTNTPNLGFKCHRFIWKDTIINTLRKPYNKYKGNYTYFIMSYIHGIERIDYSMTHTLLISHPINIQFLINVLECDTARNIGSAYEKLLRSTPFEILKKNSSQIKTALKRNDLYLSNTEKYDLLIFLELNKEEKKELMGKCSYYYRARLGDKAAEKKLINEYENCDNYKKKKVYTKRMLLAGTDRCIKTLIKNFNEPIFNVDSILAIHFSVRKMPPCTTSSHRVIIMRGLRRYHHKNKIINDRLYSLNYSVMQDLNRDTLSLLYKDFISWAEKIYGVKPEKPFIPPFLGCENCKKWGGR